MAAWVQKPYAVEGKTSASYRLGTKGGPNLEQGIVTLAIKAIQNELKFVGFDPGVYTGVFETKTEKAVKAFQTARGLVADGIFGPKSGRELFSERAEQEQIAKGIPNNYIVGQIALESVFDPGAVGSNGFDSGLVQINLDPVGGHGGEITKAQAFDPAFSVPYSANRKKEAFIAYTAQLKELAWKLAIGQHNSPLSAKRWLEAALAQPPGAPDEEALRRVNQNIAYVTAVQGKAVA